MLRVAPLLCLVDCTRTGRCYPSPLPSLRFPRSWKSYANRQCHPGRVTACQNTRTREPPEDPWQRNLNRLEAKVDLLPAIADCQWNPPLGWNHHYQPSFTNDPPSRKQNLTHYQCRWVIFFTPESFLSSEARFFILHERLGKGHPGHRGLSTSCYQLRLWHTENGTMKMVDNGSWFHGLIALLNDSWFLIVVILLID